MGTCMRRLDETNNVVYLTNFKRRWGPQNGIFVKNCRKIEIISPPSKKKFSKNINPGTQTNRLDWLFVFDMKNLLEILSFRNKVRY